MMSRKKSLIQTIGLGVLVIIAVCAISLGSVRGHMGMQVNGQNIEAKNDEETTTPEKEDNTTPDAKIGENSNSGTDGGSEETSTEGTTTSDDSKNYTTTTEKDTESSSTAEESTSAIDTGNESSGLGIVALVAVVILLVAAIAVAAFYLFRVKKQENKDEKAADSAKKAADNWSGGAEDAGTDDAEAGASSIEAGSLEDSHIGKVHNIGRRRNQQDTLGVGMTPKGLLAVVSDGMGGLADGEKVSQTAVKTMLQAAQTAAPSSLANPLYELLAIANRQVLRMLGPDQIYKSGATLLAVLVADGSFHWVTVGDSRIYFYDGDHLLQMNSEHVFKRELIVQAVNGKIDFSGIESNNQKGGLVSFLGMGDLKYIEGSLTPVKLAKGDRILLMSDGIFNTISEDQILAILKSSKTAADAAAVMEKSVLDAANPKQDNFTCVILDV